MFVLSWSPSPKTAWGWEKILPSSSIMTRLGVVDFLNYNVDYDVKELVESQSFINNFRCEIERIISNYVEKIG